MTFFFYAEMGRREIDLTMGVLAEARVDWWCLRLGARDWWERGQEVAGFFGEKFDLGEFKRKVSRSEDGDKYWGVRE